MLNIPQINLYNNSINIYLKDVGVDLYTYFKSNSMLYLKFIIFQILQILESFETHDIIHGDLSLRNICINSKNRVYFIDFGSVSLCSKLKKDSYCTVMYDAPEISKGVFIPKNDIYSIGKGIYYLLKNLYEEEYN